MAYRTHNHGDLYRVVIVNKPPPPPGPYPGYVHPQKKQEDQAAYEAAHAEYVRTRQELVSQAYDNEEELYLAAAYAKKMHGETHIIQLQYSPVPTEAHPGQGIPRERFNWLIFSG